MTQRPTADAARIRRCTLRVLHGILNYPLPLTVSQWADQYRYLSRESSAEPGPWRTDRTPYLRGIMDAISDPTVERVVFMKCARIGGTECGQNMLGYYMAHDPSPILVVQPTVENAQGWSKEQLAPMLRDTPVLRRLVRDPRARDSGNTILQKLFPGGIMTAVGANSGAGLRRRSIRILFLDEIDAFPDSAGTEGDPVDLATTRTTNFPDRKIFMASTPRLKGFSKIEYWYQRSDQRLYLVPCPHCGHFQALEWARLRYKDLREPVYICAGCEREIDESQKHTMNMAGRWEARAEFAGSAGFHINQLYSEFENARWPVLVRRWREAQGSVELLQVFVNTVLGECWEESTGQISVEGLESRLEDYQAVPEGGVVLTAGVDVQADRLEVAVRAWGRGEESWLLDFHQIPGDPSQEPVWTQLDAYLSETWPHETGLALPIVATGIDSGHQTDMVYRFCAPRLARRVFALKGASKPYAPIVNYKPTVHNNYRCRLYLVGTNDAKDVIHERLKVVLGDEARPSPGAFHFPAWPAERYGEYFDQLTAERPLRKQEGGRWRRRWVLPRGKRSEALDCEVYALVALRLARVNLDRAAKDLLERGVLWGTATKGRRRGRRVRSPGIDPWR